MAKPDDLTTNPLVSSFFYADPTGAGMTYEQLKARRAMAAALAAKSRDYPNTLGKGIFSLGESIGEVMTDRRLDAEERRIRAGDKEAAEELRRLNPNLAPVQAPPSSPAGPAAGPPPGSARAPAGADPASDMA